MNPEQLHEIWQHIVESNVFNFVIFLLAFAWIFKKINLKGLIEDLQQKIIKVIDEAKKEKEEATQALQAAEKAVENLDSELKVIVEDASKSAEVISKKILTEAEKQLQNIEANATKVIEAEEKQLIAKLSKSTSKASIEVAKNHVKSVLETTPSLHEKYINESIDELDRLVF